MLSPDARYEGRRNGINTFLAITRRIRDRADSMLAGPTVLALTISTRSRRESTRVSRGWPGRRNQPQRLRGSGLAGGGFEKRRRAGAQRASRGLGMRETRRSVAASGALHHLRDLGRGAAALAPPTPGGAPGAGGDEEENTRRVIGAGRRARRGRSLTPLPVLPPPGCRSPPPASSRAFWSAARPAAAQCAPFPPESSAPLEFQTVSRRPPLHGRSTGTPAPAWLGGWRPPLRTPQLFRVPRNW